jgi:hypothetical protein
MSTASAEKKKNSQTGRRQQVQGATVREACTGEKSKRGGVLLVGFKRRQVKFERMSKVNSVLGS